jgi:tetratricopeptide (TPR) repeat protein
MPYGLQCIETGKQRANAGLQVTGHYYLGYCHQVQGGFAAAIGHYQAIIDMLAGTRETERFGMSGLPYSGACALAAQCLIEMGEMRRAEELLQQGERAANSANHVYSKVPLAITRGQLLLHTGQPADVIKLLEPVVAVCRDNNFVGQTMRALTALGQGYMVEERPREAVPLLQEAIALQEAVGAFVDRARMVRTLAEAYRRAGQLDEADATARGAMVFAQRHGERVHEAWVHALMGDVAADRAEGETARAALAQAKGIGAELGMRLLVAYCDLRLGVLARRLGPPEEARGHLSTAVSMLRRMEARAWLGQAEAELSELDAPGQRSS